jgi:hypothetical protein
MRKISLNRLQFERLKGKKAIEFFRSLALKDSVVVGTKKGEELCKI